MSLRHVICIVSLIFCTAFGTAFAQSAPAKECNDQMKIYKVCSDQVGMYIEKRAQAVQENKKLLVIFGADWCQWCKLVNKVISMPDVASQLETEFIIINIGTFMYDSSAYVESGVAIAYHLVEKNPGSIYEGYSPTFAIVDPKTEKALITRSGGEMTSTEGVYYDPATVVSTLKRWSASID